MDTTNKLDNERLSANEENKDNISLPAPDAPIKEQITETFSDIDDVAQAEFSGQKKDDQPIPEDLAADTNLTENLNQEKPVSENVKTEVVVPEEVASELEQLDTVLPEPVQPESDQPDQHDSDQSEPEPEKTEIYQPEPVQPESDQSEPEQPESDQPVPVQPESEQPEPVQPESDQPDQHDSDQSEPELEKTELYQPESDQSVTDQSELDESKTARPETDEVDSDGLSSINYELEDAEEDDEDDDDDDSDEGDADDEVDSLSTPVEEIVQNLRTLFASEKLKRKDVEECKNQFYRSLRNEIEKQKQVFLSEGGEEIDFVANEPDIYVEGKELLQKIKEKRAELLAKEEAEKEKNVARKLAIIEQVKALTEFQGHEDFNKIYQEFKSLQQEWNEIKLIPQAKVNELWRSYQRYVEKFYDLVRINNEFREYDFKKNLEMKMELCEAAERLDDEPDVVSAFHQLQNLHQEWRDLGPVSRKDREAIWNRFKEASTLINKKYQAHFEKLKEQEEKNLELKTALCEQLEAIDYSNIKTIRDWNNKVKYVLEVQSQWRQIGYVPRKWNTKIYKRYRAACDFFFRSKNEFYKTLRGEMEENLKKKIALCERAEALKDSKDWKKTTREMIDIQKEWKTIGIVPRKHVDSIWKRFITACDYFFDQKKMHTSAQYAEEAKNMEAKKAIVDSISQIDKSLSHEDALVLLRSLMDEWHSIGHVPYRLKDQAYREFHNATEAQFDRLNIDKDDRKLETFKTNISDMARSGNAQNQLYREREKLMRQYERVKSELQTYQNNIGFLSVSSKKGNHLLDDMNQKMERIKSELQLLVRKIEALDKEL